MNNSNPALNEPAIPADTVEAVCPICNSIIAAESDETEIYCEECKCVVFQLPICTRVFNHKGGTHGIHPRINSASQRHIKKDCMGLSDAYDKNIGKHF